jgi:hypothetical protein
LKEIRSKKERRAKINKTRKCTTYRKDQREGVHERATENGRVSTTV